MRKLIQGLAIALLVFASSQVVAGDCCCCCDKGTSGSSESSRSPIDWGLSGYSGAGLRYGAFNKWTYLKNSNDGSIVSHSDESASPGYRIFAGLNFLQHFALEGGYFDAGTARYSEQSDGSGSWWAAGPIVEELSLRGIDLSLLGKMPVASRFSASGRLGAYSGHSERHVSGNDQRLGPFYFQTVDAPRGFFAGVGVEYQALRQLRFTTAYEYRAISHAGGPANQNVQSASLDIAYLF